MERASDGNRQGQTPYLANRVVGRETVEAEGPQNLALTQGAAEIWGGPWSPWNLVYGFTLSLHRPLGAGKRQLTPGSTCIF